MPEEQYEVSTAVKRSSPNIEKYMSGDKISEFSSQLEV